MMYGRQFLLFLLFFGFSVSSFCVEEGEKGSTTGEKKGVVMAGKAKAVSRGPKMSMPSVMIMDRGGQAPGALIRFMMMNNEGLDSMYVSRLVKSYIVECRLEGVNHDVAFCQMCLETGFLKFSGSVGRYQNNFCGMGAVDAFSAGDWFGSLEEGVRAHIQHLKAYASIGPLVTPMVDPRFSRVRRGTVFTVYDLSGTWAADPDYGFKIDYLLKKLYRN